MHLEQTAEFFLFLFPYNLNVIVITCLITGISVFEAATRSFYPKQSQFNTDVSIWPTLANETISEKAGCF